MDPQARLTAAQALQHPFFERCKGSQPWNLTPRQRFRVSPRVVGSAPGLILFPVLDVFLGLILSLSQVAVWTILAAGRVALSSHRLRPLTKNALLRDPYALRPVRRIIDNCAFRLYGHWVKKGEQQNRAALFQHQPPRPFPVVATELEGDSKAITEDETTLVRS